MSFKEKLIKIDVQIKNMIPKKHTFVLSVIFFLTCLNFFYKYAGTYKHIADRPCSVHVWAQCARASIALNYYKGDMNFFKPRIHKYLEGDGITGLEFPLVNYIPAVCYKIFGFNEKYYRGFVLFSITLGLLFFFLMLNKLIHNWLLSFGLTLSAYCSPVFLYYSINFMPDITSLALVLIAWYFFFNFIKNSTQKSSHLFWFCFSATLAALIKISSLVVILTVLALIILDYLKYFKKYNQGQLIRNKPKLAIILISCIGIIISWYLYSMYLVKSGGADSFAMQTVRVTDWETAAWVWDVIKTHHKFEYYPYETYILIVSIISIMVIGYKFVDRLLFTITLICLLGNLAVAYFFFYQFKDHDYYIITLTSVVFLLYYTFADFLNKAQLKFTPVITYVLIFILVFNIKESMIYSKTIFTSRFSREFIPYYDPSAPFNDLEPKLRKLGIKRTDRTLVGFDALWCVSLYKMDQLGYTFADTETKENIDLLIKREDFKYLILTDTVKFNSIYPNVLKDNIIGSHRGLLIYKLR